MRLHVPLITYGGSSYSYLSIVLSVLQRFAVLHRSVDRLDPFSGMPGNSFKM